MDLRSFSLSASRLFCFQRFRCTG